MKKLILIALAVSILQIVNAQETEIGNKVILGGSFNFLFQNNGIYSNNTSDTKGINFAFSPYFGKEISQKLFVGLQLDYRITRNKIGDINESKSDQFGIGLFTRHILNPNRQFSFYIQPYMEYNLRNVEDFQDSNVTREEKAHYYELGVGLGVFYNINNNVRATLRTGGLNYVNGKWEFKDTDTKNDFSSFGINLRLSTIYFGFELRI